MQSDLKLARLSAFKQMFIVGSIVRIFCLHILSPFSDALVDKDIVTIFLIPMLRPFYAVLNVAYYVIDRIFNAT